MSTLRPGRRRCRALSSRTTHRPTRQVASSIHFTPITRQQDGDCEVGITSGRLQVVECASSIAGARNRAAAHARGAVLGFVDDDTILLTPNALQLVCAYAFHNSHGYGVKSLWTRPQS